MPRKTRNRQLIDVACWSDSHFVLHLQRSGASDLGRAPTDSAVEPRVGR